MMAFATKSQFMSVRIGNRFTIETIVLKKELCLPKKVLSQVSNLYVAGAEVASSSGSQSSSSSNSNSTVSLFCSS